ncbi:MAG: methyl-accepting chemotaxis protein, partial [Treponema sp.]|nr:methyl-accepting chemotaxis protein [Treponema sp.]
MKLMALLVGVVVVSNVLLVFVAYSISKPALEKSVEANLAAIAENVASEVRLRNDREFHMLEVIANTTEMQNPDIPTQDKCAIIQHAKETDSNYENITFYDKNGMAVSGDGVLLD